MTAPAPATSRPAKTRMIIYWISTIAIAFSFISGGAAHLMRVPQVIEGIMQLGYPLYFIILLGVWKVLGGIAIVAPRFPLLKEWAYAGMIFELTGATVSQAFGGGDVRHVLVPLILAGVVVASWALRPDNRSLTLRASS